MGEAFMWLNLSLERVFLFKRRKCTRSLFCTASKLQKCAEKNVWQYEIKFGINVWHLSNSFASQFRQIRGLFTRSRHTISCFRKTHYAVILMILKQRTFTGTVKCPQNCTLLDASKRLNQLADIFFRLILAQHSNE